MQPVDTSWGGQDVGFPETTWSGVGASGGGREKLEQLCRKYWKPVYHYLRVARIRSNEDAKDLAQAFFIWLLEGDALQRYLPDFGSFRNYLKVLLNRFVWHQDEALHRLKRGGSVRVFSIDDPNTLAVADPKSDDPEAEFDRAWLSELARNATREVRQRFESAGKRQALEVYDEYENAGGPQPPSYAELATRLGLTESEIRKMLFVVRDAIRTELRAQLAETVRTLKDLESEWNELLRE